uniref:G_PROTEIN_RECEP_F1_2 domain-containing protein n=1 Tax=Rhodnius prolixus TaxID=13249 RepID=T1HL76_RHOPR
MNESLARLILEKPTSSSQMDPLYIVIPMTVLYSLIFLTGVIGNVSTCIVIARNRHMHTATNYYLFSLAISDLLLLISGLPQEMYQLWSTIIFDVITTLNLQSYGGNTEKLLITKSGDTVWHYSSTNLSSTSKIKLDHWIAKGS